MREKSRRVHCRIQTVWDTELKDADIQVSNDGLFNIFYKDFILTTWESYVIRVVYDYETIL